MPSKNNIGKKILIIGGGIHGAYIARYAAQNGFSVTLLEKSDFASGTSSRSSKMAHGGLRYLELFDFKQVFEGIKARDELFKEVPHLAKPEKFLIPIPKNNFFFKYKLKIGLMLYDLMLKNKSLKHFWIPRKNLNFQGFNSKSEDLEGCFVYNDGLMNDSRIVIENILLAEKHGATCLNYSEVIKSRKLNKQREITYKNCLNETTNTVICDIVINCTGPWVNNIDEILGVENNINLKYSRGSHLIFNTPWNTPSLFLPMPGKARYYFVWKHLGGTMVGTTEREITNLEENPEASKSEVQEILDRLKKDLPSENLNESTLYYSFAGIRTLPMRDRKSETGTVSRKHIWKMNDNVLSLYGGKYTTASWTAFEGLKLLSEHLSLKSKLVKKSEKLNLGIDALNPDLKKAVSHCLEKEHVKKIEDLMRRRLGVEYLPNYKSELYEKVITIVKEIKPLLID